MNEITIKKILILFQEWQLEKEVPNYNFMHNVIANNFIEQNGLENLIIINESLNNKR